MEQRDCLSETQIIAVMQPWKQLKPSHVETVEAWKYTSSLVCRAKACHTSSRFPMGAEQSQLPGYSTVDLDMSEDAKKQHLSALIQKAEYMMQGSYIIMQSKPLSDKHCS